MFYKIILSHDTYTFLCFIILSFILFSLSVQFSSIVQYSLSLKWPFSFYYCYKRSLLLSVQFSSAVSLSLFSLSCFNLPSTGSKREKRERRERRQGTFDRGGQTECGRADRAGQRREERGRNGREGRRMRTRKVANDTEGDMIHELTYRQ